MKAYIAGPMRGKTNYNFDAFDDAKYDLSGLGYDVISPADLDRILEGWVQYPPKKITGDLRRFMRRDLEVIMNLDPATDKLVLLEGWEDSKGALLEVAMADFCGVVCVELADLLEEENG
jgi:hypothetical protein